MPFLHSNVAGVWKKVLALHTRISTGAWKDVNVGYVRVGGVWKKFFELCMGGASQIGGGLPETTGLLKDNPLMPENAEIGARWDPDGGVYYYENSTVPDKAFPGTRNGGTWIGGCPNTEYEGRWIHISGDAADLAQISEPAIDVWRVMNIGNGISMQWDSNGPSIDEGFIEFQLRRISDNVVVLTDQFEFIAWAEDPTPK